MIIEELSESQGLVGLTPLKQRQCRGLLAIEGPEENKEKSVCEPRSSRESVHQSVCVTEHQPAENKGKYVCEKVDGIEMDETTYTSQLVDTCVTEVRKNEADCGNGEKEKDRW